MRIKLVLVLCLIYTAGAFAAAEVYFSDSEKAFISLLIKSSNEVISESQVQAQAQAISRIVFKLKSVQFKKTKSIEVESFPEFIEKQRNTALYSEHQLSEIPEEKLLERLQPIRYFSSSSQVQKKIDNYERVRNQKFLKFLGFVGIKSLNLDLTRQSSLEQVVTEIQESVNTKVEQLTANLSVNKSPEVMVLSKLIKAYFKALPSDQKSEILYRMSLMSLTSEPMDIFLVMIQNSGPQMQKLIQIMGRSDKIPKEFQNLFQKLESQVQAVPWWKVKQILQQSDIDLNQFTYFEHAPIGVGTMAQTHRAQYLDENGNRKNAAMRFLKPGIEKLLEMDHQILVQIASEIDSDPDLAQFKLPSLAKIVEDLHSSVVEELSLTRTIWNQLQAYLHYTRKEFIDFNNQKNELSINIPKASFYKSSIAVMIQDLVFGKKPAKEFSEYKEIYPDLYRVVSEKIAEMWIEEAFFKSGFFHADLHQGNILASYTDNIISVHLLDFGMVGQLNRQLKESALLLALGIKLNRADIIADSLLKLSKMNNEALTYLKLQKLVQGRINFLKNEQNSVASIEAWTAWALDQGIELNYEFLKLNRGLTAIQGLLSDSKSPLSFQKIAQKIAVKNYAYVSKLLLKESKLKMFDYAKIGLTVFENMDAQVKPQSVQCRSLF